MLVKFACEFEDHYFYERYMDDLIGSAVPYLPNLREICIAYLRDGRFFALLLK